MSNSDNWDDVRKTVARFDLEHAISTAIKLVGEGDYWEVIDTPTDAESIIRNHFSHTNGDSGIPNMIHVDEPEKVIFENTKKVLDMNFRKLVLTSIFNNYYTKNSDLYNWEGFFHYGSELEAIHIGILLDGNEKLRKKWSEVLSEAFILARNLDEQLHKQCN